MKTIDVEAEVVDVSNVEIVDVPKADPPEEHRQIKAGEPQEGEKHSETPKDEEQAAQNQGYPEEFTSPQMWQNKKVFVKFSCPEMGRGVFAGEDIAPGEIIERAPIVPLGWRGKYHGDPQISRYLYPHWGCKCKECQVHGSTMYMVLGFSMIYNHQDTPTAKMNFNYRAGFADIVAILPIWTGDEIFVSYGERYFSRRPKHIIKKEGGETSQSEPKTEKKNENGD